MIKTDTRYTKSKVLVILGPTSAGKTDLALSLTKKFNGELVSCDSRQLYKGLDIGTGKLPNKLKFEKGNGRWNISGVKVWMYDVADPKKQYNVANYVKGANKVIDDILAIGKLPIVVGGTGLYLKALLEGLPNLEVPIDLKLRKQLNNLTIEQLQKKLQKNAFGKWEKMNYSDRQNPRRLIRAIEIAMNPNKVQSSKFKVQSFLKIGLTAPRNVLYQRSDERVLSRMQQGMVEEAERLYKRGLSLKRMRQLGLEYGVLADYLAGRIKTQTELTKTLQFKIHGYIKRQLTWFKKEKDINWFDIIAKDFIPKVEELVTKWYYST